MIDVNSAGCVLLGPDVVCDGYEPSAKVRVQSHCHTDHLVRAEASLSKQAFVCHPTTRDLMQVHYAGNTRSIARRLQGGQKCINLKILDYQDPLDFDDFTVELHNAKHLVGSSQVVVTYKNGRRLAYSGDIGETAQAPSAIDGLVIDPSITIGDVSFRLKDSMEELCNLTLQELPNRDVNLVGHYGMLQYALHQLYINNVLPNDVLVVGSNRVVKSCDIFRKHMLLPEICPEEDIWERPEGRKIFLRTLGSGSAPDGFDGSTFLLNRMGMSQPVKQTSTPLTWQFAVTCHSDLERTLEYVHESGASEVVVDSSSMRTSTRAANKLFEALASRMPGCNPRLSSNEFSEWT